MYMTKKNQERRNEPELQALPIINPIDVQSKFLVDSSVRNIGQGHKIGSFSLTDQKGNKLTNAFTDGHIYVTYFFFTTCGGICPIMTKQVKRVQKAFGGDSTIKILSHSVWPEVDTAKQLHRYAEKYDINYKQWRLLTGEKMELYDLARKEYMVAPAFNDSLQSANDKSGLEGGPDDFIHTQWIALIDPDRRIRGFYDGTKQDKVTNLIQDIKKLKKEYNF